jgi:hypothetical protein
MRIKWQITIIRPQQLSIGSHVAAGDGLHSSYVWKQI